MGRVYFSCYERGLGFIKARVCAVCGEVSLTKRWMICPICLNNLPRTHFSPHCVTPLVYASPEFLIAENVVPFCYYDAFSAIRPLIFDLKYNGRPGIAYDLGRAFAYDLLATSSPLPYDAIVPVPLHPLKMRRRGYNQSVYFAKGLSAVLGIPVRNLLKRCRHTRTQTRQHDALHRRENVHGAFAARVKRLPVGVHLLLVDDVITTGATAGACIRVLAHDPSVKISVASIAVAPGLCHRKVDERTLVGVDSHFTLTI